MRNKQKHSGKIIAFGVLFAVLTSLFALTTHLHHPVYAADNNFANGITVDSTGDAPDTNIGDNICDDGSGNCTLRAAIAESNATAGTQTIKFNITGTADFTNAGQNGYTIQPASALPDITDTVTIDGYTQPGSQSNTAVAPNPLNGILLIELDGSGVGNVTGLHFTGLTSGAHGSTVKGLVIGQFPNSNGTGIFIEAADLVIEGNYIGTSPDGLSDKGNDWAGISTDVGMGDGVAGTRVGGTNPSDRNLISGNESSGIYPGSDWIIQGNYIGVDATGSTAMPNATTDPSGGLSIDDCMDVLVGGTVVGAVNVISGNASHGIAPDNCPGTRIEGNLIGTDWTGEVAVPNLVGITISGNQDGTVIGGETEASRNIISGNTFTGIVSSSQNHLRISNNYIGLNKDGTVPIPNAIGICVNDDSLVGGNTTERNVISGNTNDNVLVMGILGPTSGARVSGNYIGTNARGEISQIITDAQGEGVRISGDTSDNLIGGTIGNRIAGNRGNGVGIRKFTVTAYSTTITPHANTVIGNEIYGNIPANEIPGSQGLGIDIYEATVDDLMFLADALTDSTVGAGPTPNDSGDNDTGPNGYLNFPVLNSTSASAGKLNINFNLDVDGAAAGYRVEFFANSTADPSGYGEGQIYLGSSDVTGDVTNATASLSIPASFTSGKYAITATTTEKDNSSDGFGSTSEFSAVLGDQTVMAAAGGNMGGELAKTGQENKSIVLCLGIISLVGIAVKRRKTINHA